MRLLQLFHNPAPFGSQANAQVTNSGVAGVQELQNEKAAGFSGVARELRCLSLGL